MIKQACNQLEELNPVPVEAEPQTYIRRVFIYRQIEDRLSTGGEGISKK